MQRTLVAAACAFVMAGCQVSSETVFDVSKDGQWQGEVTVRASGEAAEWAKSRPGEAEGVLSRALSIESRAVKSRLIDGDVELSAPFSQDSVTSVTGEYLGFDSVSVTGDNETLVIEIKTTTPHSLRNALADGGASSGDPEGVSKTMWRLWEMRFKVICPGSVISSSIKTVGAELPVESRGREVVYESSLADAGSAVLTTTCERDSGGRAWWIYAGGVSLLGAVFMDRARRNKARLSTRG